MSSANSSSSAVADLAGPELQDPDLSLLDNVVSLMPNGQARAGQQTMCRSVATAMEDKRHLVAQAGTGTGKSLAYLVPAVLSEDKPVIIATATHALQDQLLQQDIPRLEEALGRRIKAVVLKGRDAYACLQKIREVRRSQDENTLGLSADDAQAQDDLTALLEWSKNTARGERAELRFKPSEDAWSQVSVTSAACPGRKKCDSGDGCFAYRAMDRASTADIVIVTMHMYCIASQGVPILPAHDIVVLDEAHDLEDIASSVYGTDISPAQIRRAVNGVSRWCSDLLTNRARELTDALQATMQQNANQGLLSYPLPDALSEASGELAEALKNLNDTQSIRSRADSERHATAVQDAGKNQEKQQRERARRVLWGVMDKLERISLLGDMWASWIEGPSDGRRPPTWKAMPKDLPAQLRRNIWDNKTAILSSATIPSNYMTIWGLEPHEHERIDAPSPFDYQQHAMLYTPAKMPSPKDSEYDEALHEEITQLILAAQGRTMALFSSHSALNKAHQAVAPRIPYRVFKQGDLPVPELLRQFAATPEHCLFGTFTFWQGVDLPGETLSQVVIAKLPFPRPDDPIWEARRQAFEAGKADDATLAFSAIDVPYTAMKLAQGAGRLIRSESDYGILAILDSRILTKSYRSALASELPPFRHVTARSEAERFLVTARTVRQTDKQGTTS